MTIKTSSTDPLYFNSLALGKGEIAMTICPGKQGSSTYGFDWQRDLETDLQAVIDTQATTLVTLMEEWELHAYGVGNLGSEVQHRGLDWFHMPIVDGHAPTEEFEPLWQDLGLKLYHKLQAGEKIVLHCLGGKGRTGTVAARLAIEFGMTPSEALHAVRLARSGTVENLMQENYVLNQIPTLLG